MNGDDMNDIKWEEPEIIGANGPYRARRDWAGIASALRMNPGAWAVVAEDDWPTIATQISGGRLAPFRPAGSFEAVSRGQKDNRAAKIYARFVGESS